MTTNFLKLLSLAIIASFLVSCSPSPAAQPPVAASPEQNKAVSQNLNSTPLKVGYLPQGGCAPVFLAYERGYFAEQGLKVELQTFRTGSEAIAPLSLGQLDVMGGEAGPAFFNAVYQGLDLKATMTLNQTDKAHDASPLIIRKDLYDSGQIKTLADLKGKKIAVNNERGLIEYRLAVLLRQADLTIDDVVLSVIPFPDMIAALGNGAVDAAMLSQPLAASATKPGANGEPPFAVMFPESEITVPFLQGAVFYYGKNFLDPKNHDIAVKFTIAILKANRDLTGEAWRQNDEIVQAFVKYTKVPEAVVREGVAFLFDPNGEIDTAGFLDFQKYALDREYVDYQEPMAWEQMVDDSFRNQALEILGEYGK